MVHANTQTNEKAILARMEFSPKGRMIVRCPSNIWGLPDIWTRSLYLYDYRVYRDFRPLHNLGLLFFVDRNKARC